MLQGNTPRPFRFRLGALLLVGAGACIIRKEAPPAPAAATAAAPQPKVNAAQEKANARIANLPRVDLLGPTGTKAFQPFGEKNKIEVVPIPVTGQPFADAIRVNVKEASSHPWAVQLAATTVAPVDVNDALLATFYVRTETPQEGSIGETEFVFELNGSPYTKSVSYPIQAPAEWTRIQIRFESAAAYKPGEAQMLFRMGYEPQVLEIGGVKVESFGKQIALSELPSSQGADRRRERAMVAAFKKAQAEPSTPIEGGELRFEVKAGQVIRPISPYVYGINSQKEDDTGATVRRMGGNRQTAYNWENNASNAGHDYHHQNDEWPCSVLEYKGCKTEPGAQFLEFAEANKKLGAETLATIPILDWVSADKNGPVPEDEKAPSKRWNRSFPRKNGPLSLGPDLTDGKVYQDEFVNLLVTKLGRADKGGIKFYSLDNEPALWPSTHPRIHPDKTSYEEVVARSEAVGSAIAKLDPTAVILGGVMFGWSEFRSLSEAPDHKDHNAKLGTYVDYFLAQMKVKEAEHRRRIMHVLDIHWYPEARGTKRITENDVSPKTVAARVQAPRSLWDPTYVEKSWIAADLGNKPIRLIPWFLERIAERYPGTKLGMTEYNFGVGDHISGGLAQIDALGVFGREGLYLANYWGDGAGNGTLPPYIKAAFKLFRNYDGKRGTFGDTAVSATTDQDKASIFAATDSKHPGTLTVIVINKDQRATFDAKLDLKGGKYGKAQVFTLDAKSPEIKAQAPAEIKDGHLAYRLAPLSATLFVCGP